MIIRNHFILQSNILGRVVALQLDQLLKMSLKVR